MKVHTRSSDAGSGGGVSDASAGGGWQASTWGAAGSATGSGGAPGQRDPDSGVPESGGSAGVASGGAAGTSVEGGAAGGSSPTGDPDGYVRTKTFHGLTWTQSSATATIDRASFVKPPVCASGMVPRDIRGFATLGVNLNQSAEAGDPPADTYLPTKAGLLIDVTNTAASPLRLQIAGVEPGDTWCVELYGGGGFYPWSSFKSQCWTTGGSAYDGKQGITALSLLVPGNATQPVSFDFCLNDFYEAANGPMGACSSSDPLCSPKLIDDFEGQPGAIYAQDGRSGKWVTYDDGSATGSQTVIPQSSPGHLSQHAIECRGSGFTVWGAGLGAQFNQPPGAKTHAYDASRYAGIHFWYTSSTALAFRIRTLATTSKDDTYIVGGTCELSVGDCASFLVDLPAASIFTEVNLPWSSIVQPSWSPISSTVLDPKTLVAVRFESPVNQTFDYVIDDLSFL